MANHFGLDFDLVELLAGVDADDAANHLGDDNHVTEMRLDEIGLLVGLGLLLGLSQLLDQTHGLALQAAVEPTSGTGMDEVAEFFGRKVEEPGTCSVYVATTIVVQIAKFGWRRSTYWSRSTPRYENLRKALFFLSSVENAVSPRPPPMSVLHSRPQTDVCDPIPCDVSKMVDRILFLRNDE